MANDKDDFDVEPICNVCEYRDHPDRFEASLSPYHDLQCPKCGTTNIRWTYGDYVDNCLTQANVRNGR